MKTTPIYFALWCVLCGHTSAAATNNTVESATARGLALVQRAASNWQKNKTCFSCHHQTLPMLAMTEAARGGIPLDAAWLRSQADTTHRYFDKRIEEMEEGDHVPGGARTAAYGLWALSLDHRPPDGTTTSIVTYLLHVQGVQKLKSAKPVDLPSRDGRWIASCRRPPIQGSEIGDTVLVLIGLERYAAAEQRPRVAAA